MKRLALCLAVFFLALISPAFAIEERPVNFIFLIDVSGSMVLKSTMVTAADGTQVTLFEALRQALKQVAEDPRLINPKSRISFITFGTKITEKTDWPSKLETAEDRQSLLKVIQSPDALNADKHGDTYMGGALALALQKANQMYSDTDPCTTTFIVMLTDGWDEPPAGATVKVRTVASDLTKKQSEILKKVGIKTWKVLVIGLQRLPDKKAGTTTAKELADLLGGGFIDVTKQAGGTVSERIFLALKSQVEQLKGQLTLGEGKSLKNGVVDFGTVVGNGSAKASFPLQLKSCYAEEISGLKDVTSTVPSSKLKELLGTSASLTGGACQSITTIPTDAITLHVAPTQIAPSGELGNRSSTSQEIAIDAQAHTNCPAGHYAGCFKLDSTAKVPEYIGWTLRVPGRVVADPEALKVKMRKPGFLWAEDSDVDLIGKIKELPGAHAQANYDVQILPQRATMVSSKKGDAADSRAIAEDEINGGKPLSFALDTAKADSHEFKLNVAIKANQAPGKYAGVLGVKISGPAETVAPTEIPFEVTVEPSAWEEIAPLAIPILFVLVLSIIFGLFLWITNLKRD
ncbi:MAG: VWA domain-containing protein [Cyanobacteria bacterium SZAS-4]|nr:VWA domain-containing protein [Cyanobacteria bacterium SZAS-4]